MIRVVTGDVTLPDRLASFEHKLEQWAEQGYTIVSSSSAREGGTTYVTVLLSNLKRDKQNGNRKTL